jgi:hypothetical protein
MRVTRTKRPSLPVHAIKMREISASPRPTGHAPASEDPTAGHACQPRHQRVARGPFSAPLARSRGGESICQRRSPRADPAGLRRGIHCQPIKDGPRSRLSLGQSDPQGREGHLPTSGVPAAAPLWVWHLCIRLGRIFKGADRCPSPAHHLNDQLLNMRLTLITYLCLSAAAEEGSRSGRSADGV